MDDGKKLAEVYEVEERGAPALPAEPPPAAVPGRPATGLPGTPPRDEAGRFLKQEKPGEEPVPSASKLSHSPRTRALAADLGLSEEEIQETSPAALEQTVHHLMRRVLAERRSQSIQNTIENGQLRDPEPPPVTDEGPARGSSDSSSLTSLTAISLDLDESQYDEGLVRLLKSQAEQIRRLEARLSKVQGFQQERVRLSLAEQCDRAFEKHASLLGTGRGVDLRPDDPHFLLRKAVLTMVDHGPKVGSLSERIDEAVARLRKSLSAATEASPVVPSASGSSSPPVTPQEWQAGGLAHPTHRAGAAESSGRSKAEQAVADYMRQQELAPGVPDLADEFPK